MRIIRMAAFSDGDAGGNPAGIHIAERHPPAAQMQAIAADVGYSETAFAEPTADGWHVRYFSPEAEVPFCGHATSALGGALAMEYGSGVYPLTLKEANITVEGYSRDTGYCAALQSPPTRSRPADAGATRDALRLFGYREQDLSSAMPPAFANAGANHLIIGLNARDDLSAMKYDLDAGRTFMQRIDVVTVMFVYAETDRLFHSRNPFAFGGVYEDPATGAASAAFAGYLRDIGWPHGGMMDIVQGEDMGIRSLIRAELTDTPGSSIRVSGSVRLMGQAD